MFIDDIKITPALAYATGTADRNGATLDTKGFQEVCVVVHLATIAAGAVTSVKVQQGALSNMTDAADVAGTSQTIADDDDDSIKVINWFQPTDRYVRVVIDKDGSNACAESAVYYQRGAAEKPVTQPASVTSEKHVAPEEGTA